MLRKPGLVVLAFAAGAADNYPNRPLRMLVPFWPGSPADILARWIGEKITEVKRFARVLIAAGAKIN